MARAERPEAHRGDVEHRGGVGLGALRAADPDAQAARRVGRLVARRDRVVDPLILRGVDVELGAERRLVDHCLGALVHQRALVAVERPAVEVALDEVLVQLGTEILEQVAQVAEQREVAQHRVAGLRHVPDAQPDQRREARGAPPPGALVQPEQQAGRARRDHREEQLPADAVDHRRERIGRRLRCQEIPRAAAFGRPQATGGNASASGVCAGSEHALPRHR